MADEQKPEEQTIAEAKENIEEAAAALDSITPADSNQDDGGDENDEHAGEGDAGRGARQTTGEHQTPRTGGTGNPRGSKKK